MATTSHRLVIVNNARGAIRVHRAGCADLTKSTHTSSGGTSWEVEASSERAVVEDIYGDMLAEDPDYTWHDFAGDVTFLPCCPTLPAERETTPAQDGAPTAQYGRKLGSVSAIVHLAAGDPAAPVAACRPSMRLGALLTEQYVSDSPYLSRCLPCGRRAERVDTPPPAAPASVEPAAEPAAPAVPADEALAAADGLFTLPASEPRTPRGRWAAGLPVEHPPAVAASLADAAADFRAEREAEDRRAAAGRTFARQEGMEDAGDGCSLYRMVRARVGDRQVRIHDDGGELLGIVGETAEGWRAETPVGEVLPTPGTRYDTFAGAVGAVRAGAPSEDGDQGEVSPFVQLGRALTARADDDQGATEAAREGENMGQTEPPPMDPADAEGWGLAPEEGPESRDCVRVSTRRTPAGGREQWCATHRTWEPIEDQGDDGPADVLAGLVAQGRDPRVTIQPETRQYATPAELEAAMGTPKADQVEREGEGMREMTPADERRTPARGLGYDDHLLRGMATPVRPAEHTDAVMRLVVAYGAECRANGTLTEKAEGLLDRIREAVAGAFDDPALLRQVADQVERDQLGHVTEIEVDGGGHFGWRCVQGDAEQTGIETGEAAYRAAIAHGPLTASSPFVRGPVTVHPGRGDNEHGVPRRTLAGALRWEDYDGGVWVLESYGHTDEIDEGDVTGAQAWAAGLLAAGREYANDEATVARWEHHRDAYGEWWEPVTYPR